MPGEKIVAGGARNGKVYMWDVSSSKQIDFPANTDHKVSHWYPLNVNRRDLYQSFVHLYVPSQEAHLI